MKYCKDCKYFISGGFMLWCKAPKNGISPVTGEVIIMVAGTNRRHEDLCGQEAQFFEQKQKQKKSWWSLLCVKN